MRGARVSGAIALQSAKVIRVPQFIPQLLKNAPVFLCSLGADFAGEVALQIFCDSVVVNQRVVYVEQEDDASRRTIHVIHYSVAAAAAALIAEMPRVCHGKMQPAGEKDELRYSRPACIYLSPSLARFRRTIDPSSNSSLVAPISSFSCARFVALAMAAVTVRRAINQASATCAGIACRRFAT